jgi:flagellar protein FlaG
MALGPIDSQASVMLPQTDRPAAKSVSASRTPSDAKTENTTSALEQAQALRDPPTRKEVESAVRKANQVVQASVRDLEFTVDDESGKTVIKVIDRETKEVIRQIPSDEMLAISQSLERMQGLLVKQQA